MFGCFTTSSNLSAVLIWYNGKGWVWYFNMNSNLHGQLKVLSMQATVDTIYIYWNIVSNLLVINHIYRVFNMVWDYMEVQWVIIRVKFGPCPEKQSETVTTYFNFKWLGFKREGSYANPRLSSWTSVNTFVFVYLKFQSQCLRYYNWNIHT